MLVWGIAAWSRPWRAWDPEDRCGEISRKRRSKAGSEYFQKRRSEAASCETHSDQSLWYHADGRGGTRDGRHWIDGDTLRDTRATCGPAGSHGPPALRYHTAPQGAATFTRHRRVAQARAIGDIWPADRRGRDDWS